MAPIAASSSSSPKKHDVFISFRGEDTRTNLTSHLHDAFCRKQIQTYIDYKLLKGDEILSTVMQAIEDSFVSVVVFSENYASSRWCLDELTHILLCRRNQGQIVIPVFYRVEPSHVRNQTGTYRQAFEKHERDLKHKKDKLHEWKAALNEAASLAGWVSDNFRDESTLIQKIVEDILKKLNHRYPPTELKGLVGIDNNRRGIELLLREAQTIGIWGMGGIGKTTIAKAIFVKYSSQFEGCCFLANVRENSGRHGNGLHGLRCKLISQLLEEEDLHIGTSIIESSFVECRLSRKKVFIVLDDVSTLEQLEYLVLDGESHCCFGPGSRIIITTRDKDVLSRGVDEIYEVKELEFQESLKLFSLNAFNQSLPITGYEELSKKAIDYAKGIPLALKVLGSFLRSKNEIEWDSALKKLEKIPHEKVQNVLKLSYDELSHEEREIFLDIACFLKGMDKERVINLLDSYDFYAAISIRSLQDKTLITGDNYKRVWMHDLIQEMGWEIVRQESIKEVGRRSRLWDFEEVYDVLTNNKGTNSIEGIKLDMSQFGIMDLRADMFKKMTNLRLLKFYCPWNRRSCYMRLPNGLESFPNTIRYLEWYEYPLKSLPSTFGPHKLVELNMPMSHVEKLWDGVQDLVNLKTINLAGSQKLTELPDFSKASNLRRVNLGNCESLHHVHSSILSLHSLVELVLRGCSKLKSLRSPIHLRSLNYLNVDGCSNLKELLVSSEELRRLNLTKTRIEILHSSIGRSSKLVELCLDGLRLENLPDGLSCLRSLEVLNLSNCQVIDNWKLHILFEGMRSLSEVSLNNCCNITELPNNTRHLSQLQYLILHNCVRLRSLPKLPPFIQWLHARNCRSLERVFTLKTRRLMGRNNKYVSFENCVKLDEQSLQSIVEDAHFSMILAAIENKLASIATETYCEFCLPGSRVPEWFTYRTRELSITIQLDLCQPLLGFVFCVVPDISSEEEYEARIECACNMKFCSVEGFEYGRVIPVMNLYHVHLWYDSFHCNQILSAIEEIEDHLLLTNPEVSFEFNITDDDDGRLVDIKECGVYPIYLSEYHNFIRQMKFKSKLSTNNKRPQDFDELEFRGSDEQQPLSQFKKLKLELGNQTEACRYIDDGGSSHENEHRLAKIPSSSTPKNFIISLPDPSLSNFSAE